MTLQKFRDTLQDILCGLSGCLIIHPYHSLPVCTLLSGSVLFYAANMNSRIILYTLVMLLSTVNALAADGGSTRQEQRELYQKTYQLLQAGRISAFNANLEQLTGYPLYPYLLYYYYRPRLHKIDTQRLAQFFEQYTDLPMAEKMRSKWLRYLVRNKRWEEFLQFYTSQEDKELLCYSLVARMRSGKKSYLLEDIRNVWLSGESLPKSCDPALQLLYDSTLMNSDLAWERVRLSMQRKNTGLAKYLRRWLDDRHRALLQEWLAMIASPQKGTARKDLRDTAEQREILLDGMRRLITQKPTLAISRWNDLRRQFSFSDDERIVIDRMLAIRASRIQHTETVTLMDRIPDDAIDEDILHWRLRTALPTENWSLLARWTSSKPKDESVDLRSRYWHGRSLLQLNNNTEAHKVLGRLAKERDYYGFLAADLLQQPLAVNHYPLPADKREKLKILSTPAIQRTFELLQLDMRVAAIREWNHALEKMTTYQLQLAAQMAHEWGWYQQAIFTLAKAKAWDDLLIRFPLLYTEELQRGATKNKLDASWVFALVRAESAFREDAKSPAGALGIMQVMPATGAMVARQLGMRGFKTRQLLDININVPIGSKYMRSMLDRYGGNVTLATAAYNAGPGNVNKWLSRISKDRCIPADIWVELIPFNETRKYVRRVLFHTIVYEWRLLGNTTSLLPRMPAISRSQINATSICTTTG